MRKKDYEARRKDISFFQQKGIAKRAAALMLIFTMILTLTPSTARGGENELTNVENANSDGENGIDDPVDPSANDTITTYGNDQTPGSGADENGKTVDGNGTGTDENTGHTHDWSARIDQNAPNKLIVSCHNIAVATITLSSQGNDNGYSIVTTYAEGVTDQTELKAVPYSQSGLTTYTSGGESWYNFSQIDKTKDWIVSADITRDGNADEKYTLKATYTATGEPDTSDASDTKLQSAINNGDSTQKIELDDSYTESIRIASGKEIVLDLNGKTLNGAAIIVESGASLTIKDSSTEGTVTNTITNSGTLTIEGGTFTGAISNMGGTTSITGGTFTGVMSNAEGTGTISITGGTFSSNVSAFVADNYGYVKTQDNSYQVVAASLLTNTSSNKGGWGYLQTAEGDTKYYAAPTEFAAKLGTKGYATLQKALDAAPTTDTQVSIYLLKNVEENIVIKSETIIVLYLGGYTITNDTTGDEVSHTIYVEKDARLTVYQNGKVDNVSNGKAALFNNGEVNLYGGTFDRTKEYGSSDAESSGNSYYTIVNHGLMTIPEGSGGNQPGATIQTAGEGETVTEERKGKYSSLIENGYSNDSDSLNEENGYVEGTNQKDPQLTISGGKFYGGLNTIQNDEGATLTISGGSFTDFYQSAVQNHNIATINGGTFTAVSGSENVTQAIENCGYDQAVAKGQITITDGTFTANRAVFEKSSVQGKVIILGGTFTGNKSAAIETSDSSIGSIEISGGNFKGTTAVINDTSLKNPVIVITDGNFKQGTLQAPSGSSNTETYKISGGKFSYDVSADLPEGYVVQYKTTDSMYHVVGKVVLDENGGDSQTTYKGLQDAIDNVESDSIVKLKYDITESIVIDSDKNITIDLNGCTLTNEYNCHTITVKTGGQLTIIDSGTSGTPGTVDNISNDKSAIYNEGTIKISGGTYDRSLENSTGTTKAAKGTNTSYTIVNHGTMTIDGESVVVQTAKNNSAYGKYTSLIENGFSNTNSKSKASLTIEKGTFQGGINAIKNDIGGELVIHGGNFSNAVQNTILNYNIVTIDGGDFRCSASAGSIIYSNQNKNTEYQQGTVIISGGTFFAEDSYVFGTNNTGNGSIFTISGGKFTTDMKSVFGNSEMATITISNGTTVPSFYAKAGEKELCQRYTYVKETKTTTVTYTATVQITGGLFNCSDRLTTLVNYIVDDTEKGIKYGYKENENSIEVRTANAGEIINPNSKKIWADSECNLLVGNTYYHIESQDEMNAAIAAAGAETDGVTVKLLDDIFESITISNGQTITLDLNGHMLSNASDANTDTITVASGATLTIVDNLADSYGSVVNTTSGKSVVYVAKGANLTIQTGTYSGGAYAVNVAADEETPKTTKVLITAGTFNSKIYSATVQEFVKGGLFKYALDDNYIKNNDENKKQICVPFSVSFSDSAYYTLKQKDEGTVESVVGAASVSQDAETKLQKDNNISLASGAEADNLDVRNAAGKITNAAGSTSVDGLEQITASRNETDTKVSDAIKPEDQEEAKTALQSAVKKNDENQDLFVDDSDTLRDDAVNFFEQVFVQVTPVSYKVTEATDNTSATKEYTVDITPYVQHVATTATKGSEIVLDENDGTVNAVKVGTAQPLENVNVETTVSIAIPAFSTGDDTAENARTFTANSIITKENKNNVWIRHKHNGTDYYYKATATYVNDNNEDSYIVTFDNKNGFSEFTVTVLEESESDKERTISVNGGEEEKGYLLSKVNMALPTGSNGWIVSVGDTEVARYSSFTYENYKDLITKLAEYEDIPVIAFVANFKTNSGSSIVSQVTQNPSGTSDSTATAGGTDASDAAQIADAAQNADAAQLAAASQNANNAANGTGNASNNAANGTRRTTQKQNVANAEAEEVVEEEQQAAQPEESVVKEEVAAVEEGGDLNAAAADGGVIAETVGSSSSAWIWLIVVLACAAAAILLIVVFKRRKDENA